MSTTSDAHATAHRWYTRPVLFVANAERAARFYVEQLGFTTAWHGENGKGPVGQVNHGECEVILCEDSARAGHGRLYIELTPEGLAALNADLAARGLPSGTMWWGNDVTRVVDLDGNELFFPHSD